MVDVDDGDDAGEVEAAPTDDEAAPSGGSGGASGSVSLGGGASADGKGKRSKRPRKKRESCHSKPFDILDCVPTNHTLEVGMHIGGFIVAKNHGLFDAGVAPQPDIRRMNADIGWRLLYLPIPYVGVGLEATVMPTRSPSEDVGATMYSIRGYVAGQAPWRITPTFIMGGGLLGINSDNELLNSGDGVFYYGPGGKFYINDWVAVRIEGRHLVSSDGNNGKRAHYGEIFAALDLTLRIGKWVERRDRKRNKDRDGDGYPDDDDRCPDLYAEDAWGCPENLDSDKDGIVDSRDKCPKQWGDSASGCPVRDEDGDGILDSADGCVDEPETYNGFEDDDGCPDDMPAEVKAISGVIEGIYFDSGRANVKNSSRAVLDTVVDTLGKFPKIRLKITGHTDNTGKHETNTRLSAARADAVRDYLVRKGGVDASRLETAGVGPDKPIADNGTKTGRAKNRRIEFERLADAE
ncbi:MAG: OmpA family protein [Nannocystaceae bacterium]|nr:OmpA family protein [Nannocystaceae bacterium]